MHRIYPTLAASLFASTIIACDAGALPAEPSTTESPHAIESTSPAPLPEGPFGGDSIVFGSLAKIVDGRHTFRFDTFGDEDFWGGQLQMHRGIAGAANGGVGAGVSPRLALQLGLKVDAEALPAAVVRGIQDQSISLDDPATTVALLKLNAVVGVTGFFDGGGKLRSLGIQCALCHSTVDDSFAPGIGRRLDGWANRDLNVGAIVAATAQNVQPLIDLFKNANVTLSAADIAGILNSWGPGKFDAEVFLDGKSTGPRGSAATLIPPAFNLDGVNQHTWTGWGSITYWNAFVANLEMHGKGNFTDARLADASKFPIAAAPGNHLYQVTNPVDRISPKLPALEFYQLAIAAPKPPRGSFDVRAAARGKTAFTTYHCASCHTPGITSDAGWNMHTPAELAIDAFQANRGPDGRYRTAPLNGLWTHTKGGFYHDGRFATLDAVLDHYASHGVGNHGQPFTYAGTDKADLAQYLMSL
ncbi:MAG TPA: hypothetical protein VFP84_19965 [Kofleriaceae bacterium]|nr:hypothetical protein [Kofleriaceae bacterium]